MQRTNYMYCYTPFYIKDLSIHRFWSPLGVLEPMPCGYLGKTVWQLSFGGAENFKRIFNFMGVGWPMLFTGQLSFLNHHFPSLLNHSHKQINMPYFRLIKKKFFFLISPFLLATFSCSLLLTIKFRMVVHIPCFHFLSFFILSSLLLPSSCFFHPCRGW